MTEFHPITDQSYWHDLYDWSCIALLFCHLAALAILGLSIAPAMAETSLASPLNPVHWQCWYDGNIHVFCRIAPLSPADRPATGTAAADLPPVVRTLRDHPETLRNQVVEIPLYSPPYEGFDFTTTLARATVCGPRSDCKMDFSTTPPADIDMAALRGWQNMMKGDAEQPDLAMLDS